MTTTTSAPAKIATALTAVYIDFEGNQDAPPTLLGVLWPERVDRPEFEQFVFEPLFLGAATAKGNQVSTLERTIELVVATAEAEGLEMSRGAGTSWTS